MADRISSEVRSRIMSRVKGRNTKPELLVRSRLHSMGYRFRIQRRDLPGNPDIVLPRFRKVIFVHGCFWHGHSGCKRASRPSTNREFWDKKIDGNMVRDARILSELRSLGWSTLVVWQCQCRDVTALDELLSQFVG